MRSCRPTTILVVLLLGCAAVSCSDTAPPANPVGSSTPSSDAGRLVEQRPGPVSADYPPGTTSSILTYRSNDPRGAGVDTTGLLLTPPGTPPTGGWPVIAWGHGTTGIGDDCAPSESPGAFYGATLGSMLAAGYAIAATDYIGLGTQGVHPYLLADSAARATVDMVTAAHAADDELSPEWAAVGHSQGGQATWAVAEHLRDSPDPGDYRGAVALAPAPNLSPDLSQAISDDPLVQEFYLMTLVGLATASDLDYADYLGPRALALLPAVGTRCFDDLTRTVAEHGLTTGDFTFRTPAARDLLRQRLVPHEIAMRPTVGPMLVLQGSADPVVAPAYTREMVTAARRLGASIEYTEFLGANHGGVLDAGRAPMMTALESFFR